jgi:hypothetical protein
VRRMSGQFHYFQVECFDNNYCTLVLKIMVKAFYNTVVGFICSLITRSVISERKSTVGADKEKDTEEFSTEKKAAVANAVYEMF